MNYRGRRHADADVRINNDRKWLAVVHWDTQDVLNCK